MSPNCRLVLGTWLVAAAGAPVCLAQSSYFGTGSAAKVIQISGQVSVLRDSRPWALNLGESVRVQQVIVTGADGFAVFQVADGSTFEVYPNSKVTFRNTPGNLKDLLDLWMGRVRISIQKWGGQPNHNRVRTPTAVIAVRGTVFDVVVEDELDTTLVSVEEGLVEVQHALLPRGDPRLVSAGEYIRVYKNQPLASRQIDRGSIIKRALQAVTDAIYTAVYNPGGSGGGAAPTGGGVPAPGGGGPTLPGDTQTEPPPPPPPPGGGDSGGAPPPPPGGN